MPKDSDEVRRRKRREKYYRYLAKYPDRVLAAQRKYREKNRARINAAARERNARRTHADHAKEWAKKRAKQDRIAGRPRPDVCDLCGQSGEQIVFDHCHENSHFRGWLCDRCNKVLGLANDDPLLLMQMAAYLKRTHAPSPQLTLPGI